MDNKDKINRVLQVISNNDTERTYFFQRLGKAIDPFEWLLPLKEKGYLNPSNNPKPLEIKDRKGHYTIPSWEILDFILNVAKKNKTISDPHITYELVLFIDSIIEYNIVERIDNYITDSKLLKIIFLLPFEQIKINHIVFINTALHSTWDNLLTVDVIKKEVVPVLLDNHPKSHFFLKHVIDYLLQYKKVSVHKGKDDEYISIVSDYWLMDLMNSYRKLIADNLMEDGVEVAEKKVRKIITQDKSQFNLIWIPHIEEESDNYFLDRYEVQITFFIRDCLMASNLSILRTIIDKYISDEHPIFRRLAVFIINQRYNDLKDIFWSIKDNPLEYYSIKHELFPFFENRARMFNSDEIRKIIEWIEKKDYSYLDYNELSAENKNIRIAFRKKEWLLSLIESNSPEVQELYNKYNKLNPTLIDHPGLDYWMEEMTSGNTKSDDLVDFCDWEIEKIADYLSIKHNTDNVTDFSFDEDYSEHLKDCIIKNPNKFLDNLSSFQNVQLIYQYGIIRAFFELWQKNNDFNWSKLFDFIYIIVSKKLDYTYGYEPNEYAYRDWVIGAICDLIEEGTRTDRHAFNPDFLPICKIILLLLEERVLAKSSYSVDLATTILNSTRGKIYSAIINFSLRFARLFKKNEIKRFDPDILNLFNKRLEEKKETEFFYSLGKYTSNLLYLDQEWLYNNLNDIFAINDNTLWTYTMSGFLFYQNRINKDIYLKLKEGNHLYKALNTNFEDKNLDSRVIQFLCISYINNWEDLNDKESLLKYILDQSDYNHLKEVIHFIWHQRRYLNDDPGKTLIIPLLIRMYNSILNISDLKIKSDLFSDLSKWIVYISKFEPTTYNIFKDISKFSSNHFNTTSLIKGLSRIASQSPLEVADILLIIIEHDETYPYYKEEVIKEILDVLSKNMLEKEIVKICNLLIKKGLYNYKEVLNLYKS